MTRFSLFFMFLAGFSAYLFAQDVRFQIDVITHMNTANQLLEKDDTFYAATSGGLLIRNADGSEEVYNVKDEIRDHRLSSMAISERNIIALGSTFGNLAFIDRSDNTVLTDQNLLGNEIVDMEMISDTLWVLTTQFVSVYLYSESLQRFQFRESYQEFNATIGRFSSLAYADKRIWLGSEIGLISAPSNFLQVNLYSGANWALQTQVEGLPSSMINDIVSGTGTSLLIATSAGLSSYDGSTFQTLAIGDIRHISLAANGDIFVTNRQTVFKYDGSQLIQQNSIRWTDITDLLVDNSGDVWIGTLKRGIRNLTTGEKIYRDGPLDNYIGEIHIDNLGRIWCTTGLPKDERRQGLFVYSGAEWKNHLFSGGSEGRYSNLNSTMAIMEDAGGSIWVGAWGGGIAVFDENDDFTILNTIDTDGSVWLRSSTRDDTTTVSTPTELRPILSPVSASQYYSVVTDILLDQNTQSIWIMNSAASSNRSLLRYRGTEFNQDTFNNANWESYSNPFGVREWFEMTVDVFGDFWLASSYDIGSIGVAQARLGENNAFATASFTESANNLKSNATSSIAADGDGYVWVGTRSGLSAILGGNVFDFRDTYQPLGFQINDIFVDPENNKWFATDRGVSILKGSGSPFDENSWIHIIPQNSSVDADIVSSRKNLFIENLPSENIHSVTLDPQSGDVYLGSDAGIAIVKSNPFSSPFENFDLTKAGPNPFILNGRNNTPFAIYNLATGSEVRIVTASGQLIRKLDRSNFAEIQGNSAIWDGRNEEGRLVASGVYLYLITNEQGQQTSGKFMVVQE
ncbi:MAG: two-component regulator propeller domain-containing protein [Calditrichota bacterium]